jgi:hypothetical protein
MSKTYESLWHNPETGVDIIIARGSNEKYVRSVAQMSQFVPYTIREYQTEDNIREMYREWRKDNGNKKPNRVIVKMHWEDGDNTEKGYQVDTIALQKYQDENYPGDDCWILYYVSSLKGLCELMKPDNGSDFVVDEVLEFYKK